MGGTGAALAAAVLLGASDDGGLDGGGLGRITGDTIGRCGRLDARLRGVSWRRRWLDPAHAARPDGTGRASRRQATRDRRRRWRPRPPRGEHRCACELVVGDRVAREFARVSAPPKRRLSDHGASCREKDRKRSTSRSETRRDRISTARIRTVYPGTTVLRPSSSGGPIPTEVWVSVERVAHHLGVSQDSIYRWIEGKGLPAHRSGRLWEFKVSDVDAWVTGGGADESTAPKPDDSLRRTER